MKSAVMRRTIIMNSAHDVNISFCPASAGSVLLLVLNIAGKISGEAHRLGQLLRLDVL